MSHTSDRISNSDRHRDRNFSELEAALEKRLAEEVSRRTKYKEGMLEAVPVIASTIQDRMTLRTATIKSDGSFRVQLRTVCPNTGVGADLHTLQVKVQQHMSQDRRLTQMYVTIAHYDGFAMELLDKTRICFVFLFPLAIVVHAVERLIYYRRTRLKITCTGKFASIAER